jgi:hypothetical protein
MRPVVPVAPRPALLPAQSNLSPSGVEGVSVPGFALFVALLPGSLLPGSLLPGRSSPPPAAAAGGPAPAPDLPTLPNSIDGPAVLHISVHGRVLARLHHEGRHTRLRLHPSLHRQPGAASLHRRITTSRGSAAGHGEVP